MQKACAIIAVCINVNQISCTQYSVLLMSIPFGRFLTPTSSSGADKKCFCMDIQITNTINWILD